MCKRFQSTATLGLLWSSLVVGKIENDVLLENYVVGAYNDVATTSLLNPGNTSLAIPAWQLMVDFRPQLKTKFSDSLSVLIRPRFRPQWIQTNGNSSTAAPFRFDEASVQWTPGDKFRLVAGLHYYQWGPAEYFSPSNPFIHFSFDQRSVIFRQQGRALLRGSFMIGSKSSVDLLIEPFSNGQAAWIAGQAFVPKAMLKGETKLGETGGYAGLTLGSSDRNLLFVGEYLSAYLADAWSVYLDARHTVGAPGYYPGPDGLGGTTLLPASVNSSLLQTLTITGVRYEGFLDSRLEYIYNSYGYTPGQRLSAVTAVQASPSLAPFLLTPGMEFPGQHYLYTSFRTDRLGRGDSWRVSLRYLHSLADHSGAFFAASEWAFSDNMTWIVEPMFSHAGSQDEFSVLPRWNLLTELRIVL